MQKPKRIQRKRSKNWKMPPNTFYVGRPSKWGNPFTGKDAVKKFAERMERNKSFRPDLFWHFMKELRGHNLACWCPLNKKCHADVLLKIANGHFPYKKRERKSHIQTKDFLLMKCDKCNSLLLLTGDMIIESAEHIKIHCKKHEKDNR